MNEIKNNELNITDLVFDAYNNVGDFLKNNKGIIAQTALGAGELFAAMKGLEYSKELGSQTLHDASIVVGMLGAFNIYLGAYVRPIYNVFVRNPWIEDKIEQGYINPEDRGRTKESFGLLSNKEIKSTTHYLISGCKGLINDTIGLIKKQN